jgi:hypothetical protein
MKKEFVPYELAVKLKTLGFDEPCLAVFNDSKQFRINSESTNWNDNVKNGDTTSSPLYQQAFRWFREKHDLFISIYHYDSGYEINDLRRFGTYEEAQLARLTKLIEIIETEKLKIMTPKEKAEELVDKFIMNVLDYEGCSINDHKAKQCALIAVDEIYKLRMTHGQHLDYDVDKINYYSYWQEVKKEIEKF